jgi:ribosomal protein L7/L12
MPLESLNCPNCGAPLPDPAGRALVMCTHCHTVVRVASGAGTTAPTPPATSTAPEAQPYTPSETIPAHISARLVELLRAGRKIEAVEYYQDAAGVDEEDARDVVDAIQAGLPPTFIPTGEVDLDRIKWLLANRRRLYAVQLYREQAGVTMSDAAKAVDAIAAGREPPPIVRAAEGGRLPAGELAEVLNLIKRGQKIEAIKHYHERTGVGLKEAKDAVDAIERGQEPPQAAMARAMHHVPPGVDLVQIQDLLRKRQKIEAIKAYREASGLGLKEAKDAVEAIAASTPGVDPSLGKSDYRGCFNCLGVIVICFLLLFGGCGTVAQTTGTYRCAVAELKRSDEMAAHLGSGVNAGYLVLAPNYGQSWDLDGSWRRSMDLFMPAWGSRGLGLLYMEAVADDSGYTAMRATLWKDFKRHVVMGWGQVECR